MRLDVLINFVLTKKRVYIRQTLEKFNIDASKIEICAYFIQIYCVEVGTDKKNIRGLHTHVKGY